MAGVDYMFQELPVKAKIHAKDSVCERFLSERRAFWDLQAQSASPSSRGSLYYHKRLKEVFRFLIEPGRRVLELGCGQGDLLAALRPSFGVGVDLSSEMINIAAQQHPHLHFIHGCAEQLCLRGAFDVIILSDLVNDLWDIQAALKASHALCHPRTRIILNTYSRLWQIPLAVVRKLELARPLLEQNWVTVEDLGNLLTLSGFDVLRSWSEILFPLPIPFISRFMNRFLVKIWPLWIGALTNFIVARPQPMAEAAQEKPFVSIVVPARNEAENIGHVLQRVPKMGSGAEIVFVEGNSSDNTYETIQKAIEGLPQDKCRVYRQPGKGKGDAVRVGFSKARGDVLMILDADLTVPPEDLPRFYEALVSGRGEFINGVRLVYPMEKRAMRFWNLVGNKFFTFAFSALLGQDVKDTLCGTKVLWKKDYERIAANRSYFGDFDPFGDFDLLFGAAKLNLKIVDMPIRYRERMYGETNIQRWRHGLILLRMVLFAARRIKFV
jgi:SAM-dependent methyltransferase